jgi:anaerobic magnesium-protoporphyrin IX monomethyl ester cyclase
MSVEFVMTEGARKVKILIIMLKGIGDGNRRNYSYIFPYGIAYISAVLKSAGHAVTCLNLHHYEGAVENLVRDCLLGGGPYDIVCTGGLSAHFSQIKQIVQEIKRTAYKAKIIIGGGVVSSEPELIFNELSPDYIVIGEGEETIKELVSHIEQQRDTSTIAGIGYRGGEGRFVKTGDRPAIMDLDAIPWPDFEGFEYDVWLKNLRPTDDGLYDCYDYPRVYPIITSRSCPYRCTFCFHPLGNKYRQRSMDSVIHELEVMIPRHRINLINIDDELFSYNDKRVYEFCERLGNIAKNVEWDIKWICSMRVDGLDENLLVKMRDAGCIGVGFGFESYSSAVLKSMKKAITPAQIKRAVDLTLSLRISSFSFFIFGDRAETLQTARETLEFCKSIQCANVGLVHLSPYPGTEIYAYCVANKIIKNKMDYIENCCANVYKISENMPGNIYYKFLAEVASCMIRYYVTVAPFRVSCADEGAYVVDIKCPYCDAKVRYANFPAPPGLWSYKMMTYCRSCRRSFHMTSRTCLFLIKILRVLLVITPMWIKIQALRVRFGYILPRRQKRSNVHCVTSAY